MSVIVLTNIFNTIRKINNLYNNTYQTTLKATPEEILNRKYNIILSLNKFRNIVNYSNR